MNPAEQSEQHDEAGAEAAAGASKLPDQSRVNVPYIYFNMSPVMSGAAPSGRSRACPLARSMDYTCLPFDKPISRPFPAVRKR